MRHARSCNPNHPGARHLDRHRADTTASLGRDGSRFPALNPVQHELSSKAAIDSVHCSILTEGLGAVSICNVVILGKSFSLPPITDSTINRKFI